MIHLYGEYKSEARGVNLKKLNSNNGRSRLYFSVIMTLNTGVMKDHGKVILMKKRMQL